MKVIILERTIEFLKACAFKPIISLQKWKNISPEPNYIAML